MRRPLYIVAMVVCGMVLELGPFACGRTVINQTPPTPPLNRAITGCQGVPNVAPAGGRWLCNAARKSCTTACANPAVTANPVKTIRCNKTTLLWPDVANDNDLKAWKCAAGTGTGGSTSQDSNDKERFRVIAGVTAGGIAGLLLLAGCVALVWFLFFGPGAKEPSQLRLSKKGAWFCKPLGFCKAGCTGGGKASSAGPRYSVGVDVGASCSGYAFVKLGDITADVNQTWEYSDADKFNQDGSTADVKMPKTMTAILYRKHLLRGWQAVDWGRHAFMAYQKLPLSKRQDYQLFEDFKIALANSEERTRFMLQMRPNCDLTLEGVISDFLSFIKGHAVRQLGKHYGDVAVSAADIAWTLTVPANWTPEAQEIMKQAAVNAGMVRTAEDTQLKVATEPEAAARSCLHRNVVKDTPPKATFMVVDAGGATTDITVHQVFEDGQLEEPLLAVGIMAGSKHIDRKFEDWLAGQVGEEAFHRWRQENPVAYLKLMHGDWDHAKCEYGLTDEGSPCIFNLDDNLLGAQAPERVKSDLSARGILSGGKTNALILKQADIGTFFRDVVEDILNLVKKSVQTAGKVPDKILLVGGLGSSPHLKEELQALAVQEGWVTEVITPVSGLAAVVEGAALAPKEEIEGIHQVAEFGYGLWIPRNQHPGITDVSNTSVDQITPVWQPMISIGEHLQTQMKQLRFAVASTTSGPYGSPIPFKVYRTNTRTPVYGSESQGEVIGTLEVDLAGGQGASGLPVPLGQQQVEFWYRLGRTKVIVLAKTKSGCCGSFAFHFQ